MVEKLQIFWPPDLNTQWELEAQLIFGAAPGTNLNLMWSEYALRRYKVLQSSYSGKDPGLRAICWPTVRLDGGSREGLVFCGRSGWGSS